MSEAVLNIRWIIHIRDSITHVPYAGDTDSTVVLSHLLIFGSRELTGQVGQMCSTDDREKNFSTVEEIVKRATSDFGGILKLVCLPESFDFIGDSTKVHHDGLDGPLFTRYKELAKKYNIWISYGGFHEGIANDPTYKCYNTHVIVDNEGQIKATYRKMHMCVVSSENGTSDESEMVKPGDQMVVCDSPVGKLGLSICYDIRFPELYVSLRKMGAEVILIPAAFMIETGINHWQVLLTARAIETQCFIVAAAQIGEHNDSRMSFGKSLVVCPWGNVVACCVDSNPTFTITNIDLDRTKDARKKSPCYDNRRPDVYGDVGAKELPKSK
ncbi:nitrilase 1 [Planoprotostelium fungivorum]|uniref:Nitrilase 1 n=1 Tax=Planoprotostelium fungivorum TaxID=1890364 RepID=A0A2P6N5E7_9EUKA|nr:nitrilase 1 [Planoprotostelium fungivorum]